MEKKDNNITYLTKQVKKFEKDMEMKNKQVKMMKDKMDDMENELKELR